MGSRNLEILENMLGEEDQLEQPRGRIGKALMQLYEQGGGGGSMPQTVGELPDDTEGNEG